MSTITIGEALLEGLKQLNDKRMKGPALSRRELFLQEDLPAMRPLPEVPYGVAEWKRVKAGVDDHIEFQGHLYSVPFSFSGEHLEVRASTMTVEIFHRGERISSHSRSYLRRGVTTTESHMPMSHRKHAEWTPERMIHWAATIGPNASLFTEALLARKSIPNTDFEGFLAS